jgi:hypothetical protein
MHNIVPGMMWQAWGRRAARSHSCRQHTALGRPAPLPSSLPCPLAYPPLFKSMGNVCDLGAGVAGVSKPLALPIAPLLYSAATLSLCCVTGAFSGFGCQGR